MLWLKKVKSKQKNLQGTEPIDFTKAGARNEIVKNVLGEKDPRIQQEKIRELEKRGIFTGKQLDVLFGRPTNPSPRPTQTPISTINSVFTPPPSPVVTAPPTLADIGIEPIVAQDFGQNVVFEKEREIEERCKALRKKGIKSKFCRDYFCKKNPFAKRCRDKVVQTQGTGTGAGTFDKETGVSSLETTQENLNYCLKNPNDPSCKGLYNEDLINTLDGGIDNIYATSLELPSDCLTNPSKVDLNSCEGLHPKDIYQNMDKAQVNEPMPPQTPLQDQVGVSNLTENPITDTKVSSMPTLSMYYSRNGL